MQKLARAAIVVVLGIATLAYGSLEKRVTVRVEGRPVAVRTFASNVGEVLARAGIPVGPKDRVIPAPTEHVGDGATIEVRRAKEITLLLDGTKRRVIVTGLTVAEVLEEIELRGSLVDRVHPSRASSVSWGMTIAYDPAVAVTVVHDREEERVITNARTVGDVIDELGVRLGARDYVRPRRSVEPEGGMRIRVFRVGARVVTRTIELPYQTLLRRDRNLEYGERRVIQDGVAGMRRERVRLTYVNGELASRRVIRSTVLREPRARIIAVGSGFPGCVCNDGTAVGEGTWYGDDGLVAAHRTLPFGTVVRVENLANGKWVNVRIVTRGPYGEGRIIDLSDDAFARIASLSTGVIDVRIRW